MVSLSGIDVDGRWWLVSCLSVCLSATGKKFPARAVPGGDVPCAGVLRSYNYWRLDGAANVSVSVAPLGIDCTAFSVTVYTEPPSEYLPPLSW